MNFCLVSILEIDSIFVTFDFMAIQRGLDFFLKVYIFLQFHVLPKEISLVLPLFFSFKSLAFTQFLGYLHISYMKSVPISCNF